jgi:HPt (histidine-containing phosphotransfer) domain-containing protein
LPEMSGLALAKILMKKLPQTVKFYAITAQVLHEERENVLNQGFDGIIMKPFKEEDILSIFSEEENIIPTVKFDLSNLKKITFGEENQLKKIIKRFTEESKDDMALLNEKLAENDDQNSRLIVHRLAGRIAQIGARKLAIEFRKQEINFDQNKGISINKKQEIASLIIKLKELIKLLNQEIYSMP